MKLLSKIRQIQLKVIDWFLTEPKRLVRLFVLSVCSIVVFFQLWECVMKLLHPPISTASHFDLNRTMHYPAVTFCRNPGFKADVMSVGESQSLQRIIDIRYPLQKYNLSYHPSITSSWNDFNFEAFSLSDLFDEATYTRDEVFIMHALGGNQSNVEIDTTLHFSYGKCHTVKPKVSTVFPVRCLRYWNLPVMMKRFSVFI